MKLSNSKHKFSISSAIFAGLILISGQAQSAFYDSAVGKKQSKLLNGRLTIQAPSTSRRDELTIDLHSEKNLFKDQTVLKYNKNGKQLRIVATELFAWRTGNLQGNLAKLIYSYPQKVGLQYKIAQLDRNRYELVPSKLLLIKGSALVRTLFFVNSDDTIQSIDIYMNSQAVLNPGKATALATKLLASIKAGKRKLRKGPRTVFLGSKRKPHFFKIRLPKGFVISSKKQNNARVHIIRKLVPLGKSQTSLAIYIGNEPSPYHSHFGDYDTSRNAASSRLLGQFIHWHKLKKADSLKRRMAKASQQLPWSNKNVNGQKYYIHVFADSESNRGMKQMVRLAGKLKYVKKPRYAFVNTHNQSRSRGLPSRRSYPSRRTTPRYRNNRNSSNNRRFFDNNTRNNNRRNDNGYLDKGRSRNRHYDSGRRQNHYNPNDYPEDNDGYSRGRNDHYYDDHNNDYQGDHNQRSFGNEF